MTEWVRWMAPPAIIISIASPACATQYLTVEQAQKQMFPTATQFVWSPVVYTRDQAAAIEKFSGEKVQSRGEQVWKAQNGGQFQGFFIVDYVIGKHLVIDYAVALDPQGRVSQVEIMEYRESYGGEVANPDWLAQFNGKTSHDPLEMDRNIRNISGATLSSRHVTEGIKRILAIYETCLK
jgi:Na+-translocating ferredoxin:NAD+ oxidoreductase RnfG subunit